MNLDAILEEVLQQLIIPGLRPSIIELCEAEQVDNWESSLKQPNTTLNTTFNNSKEIENILMLSLPKHIQDVLNGYTSNNEDIFCSTIKELNYFCHTDIISNKMETTGTSPLEQLNRLPIIIRSIMDEVS